MNMQFKMTVMLIVTVLCLALSNSAQAAGKNDRAKAALQARFEQRYPDLQRFKAEGNIGETSRGLIEAVKESDAKNDAVRRMVEDENTDRKALYALIAEEDGISVDLVAKRAAKRNFEKARPGEFLKSDGQWKRK